MNALSRVLLIKILLTVFVWCLPLLFFPLAWLQVLGFPAPEPPIFLRLLGMAYAALVVGYCFGLRDSMRGQYPHSILCVGIISNGGACILLVLAALTHTWLNWGVIAQWIMYGSLIGTGTIALALMVLGFCRRVFQA